MVCIACHRYSVIVIRILGMYRSYRSYRVYRSYRLYEFREIDTLTEALQLAAQDVARYRTSGIADEEGFG